MNIGACADGFLYCSKLDDNTRGFRLSVRMLLTAYSAIYGQATPSAHGHFARAQATTYAQNDVDGMNNG